MMNKIDLPLSWIITSKNSAHINEVLKLNNRLYWYALFYIPENNDWIEKVIRNDQSRVFIRGLNKEAVNELDKFGFNNFQSGEEAVINLNQKLTWKKSVEELYRRGRKLGRFREVSYSERAANKLREFKKVSRHGNEPELKYLFNCSFITDTRLFVIEDEFENWIAAVIISPNNIKRFQCELLLKRNGRYPGAMEYLIIKIAKSLQREGIKEFSLGEVPFIKMNLGRSILKLLLIVLKPFIQTGYNFDGLYKFKNKFNPSWRPVYICVNKKITMSDLFLLSLKTNFLYLLLFKIKHLFISKSA